MKILRAQTVGFGLQEDLKKGALRSPFSAIRKKSFIFIKGMFKKRAFVIVH